MKKNESKHQPEHTNNESTPLLLKTITTHNKVCPIDPPHTFSTATTIATAEEECWNEDCYHVNACDHEQLQHFHQLNFYSLLMLVYFALACSLFIANAMGVQESNFMIFHLSEFWGALVFAGVEALLFYNNPGLLSPLSSQHFEDKELVCSIQDTDHDSIDSRNEDKKYLLWRWQMPSSESITMMLVSFNVLSATLAAMLFVVDPHRFEEASHLIEYSSQITVTMVDFMFILQVQGSSKQWQLLLANLLLCLSIAKFLLYTGYLQVPGGMGSEQSSHYVEFLGEMINSAWAYNFALQQRRVLQLQLRRPKLPASEFGSIVYSV